MRAVFVSSSVTLGMWLRWTDPDLLAECWVRVLEANPFASVRVRVQSERCQSLASSGPCAVVRHPMYSVRLLLMIGAPLFLGAWWRLVGSPVALPLW